MTEHERRRLALLNYQRNNPGIATAEAAQQIVAQKNPISQRPLDLTPGRGHIPTPGESWGNRFLLDTFSGTQDITRRVGGISNLIKHIPTAITAISNPGGALVGGLASSKPARDLVETIGRQTAEVPVRLTAQLYGREIKKSELPNYGRLLPKTTDEGKPYTVAKPYTQGGIETAEREWGLKGNTAKIVGGGVGLLLGALDAIPGGKPAKQSILGVLKNTDKVDDVIRTFRATKGLEGLADDVKLVDDIAKTQDVRIIESRIQESLQAAQKNIPAPKSPDIKTTQGYDVKRPELQGKLSAEDAIIQSGLDSGWSGLLKSGQTDITKLTPDERAYLKKSAVSYMGAGDPIVIDRANFYFKAGEPETVAKTSAQALEETVQNATPAPRPDTPEQAVEEIVAAAPPAVAPAAPVAQAADAAAVSPTPSTPPDVPNTVPDAAGPVGIDASVDELHQALNQQVEAGRTALSEKSLWGRIGKKLRGAEERANPYAPLTRNDRAWAGYLGIKESELPRSESLEHLADLVDNSATTAIAKAEKGGLTDVIKSHRKNPQGFMNYLHARFAAEVKAKTGKDVMRIGGQPLAPEQLAAIVTDFEKANPQAAADAQKVKQFFDSRLDEAVEAGVFDPEDAAFIKANYENYVPLERILPDDLERATVNARPIGSLGRQTIIQKLEGSDLPLNNEIGTLLRRNGVIERQINRQNLFSEYYKRLSQGFDAGRIVQSADQVKSYKQVREDLKILSKVRDKLKNGTVTEYYDDNARNVIQAVADSLGINVARTTSRKGKFVGRSFVDKPNIELKAGAPTRTMLHEIGHQLDERHGLKAKFVNNKEFKEELRKLADLRFEGSEPSPSYAKYVRKGEEKIAVMFEAYIHAPGRFQEVAPKTFAEFKNFLASTPETAPLVDLKPSLTLGTSSVTPDVTSDLNKLNSTIDQLAGSAGIKDARQALVEEAIELRPDPLTGKQILSGFHEGVPVKIEVTPEIGRVLGGIGQSERNALIEGLLTLQKPFRSAWTGLLSPIFNLTSAIFYDPVAGFIISPKGTRTLVSPGAWGQFFKSFNSNSQFQRILKEGGAQVATGSQMSENVAASAKNIAAKQGLIPRLTFNFNPKNIKQSIQNLDAITGKLANANRTRIARVDYDAAIRAGKSPQEAQAAAVYAFNNYLPNYRRMSALAKDVDAFIPYTAASVAGTRSMGMAIRRRPIKTIAKMVGAGVVPAAALTIHNLSQDRGEEFYQDMIDSKKEYILDNNLIIVTPLAEKDPTTGEWTGIFKIPVAPELRGINKGSWVATREAVKGNGMAPAHVYAGALFDTMTGGLSPVTSTSEGVRFRTDNVSPVISVPAALVTGVDPRTGRDIVPDYMKDKPKDEQVFDSTSDAAKAIAKKLGISPLQVSYVLGQFGATGRMAQGQSGIKEELKQRFTGAFGKSEGKAWYEGLEAKRKTLRDPKDKEAFDLVHAKNERPGMLDSVEKVNVYLNRPEVLKADRELDAEQRAKGKRGNPLFDLKPEELNRVLVYRSAKMLNAGKQTYDKNGEPLFTSLGLDEPWYDKFRDSETAFWDQIEKENKDKLAQAQTKLAEKPDDAVLQGRVQALQARVDKADDDPATFSGAKKPKPSDELQAILDVYYTLPKGTGQRSAMIRAYPEILQYWDESDGFTNRERAAIGLKPLSEDEDSFGGSGGKSYNFKGKRYKVGRDGKVTEDATKKNLNIDALILKGRFKPPAEEKASTKPKLKIQRPKNTRRASVLKLR